MIALIDYGVGNIRNVYRALTEIGLNVKITCSVQEVNDAKAIILPGVGAYRDSIDNLKKTDLIPCIQDNVQKGKMLLGICLGMQLLFDRSFEGGTYQGIGMLPGDIVRFKPGLKVPHMGWNQLNIQRQDPIVKGLAPDAHVYFVHSYYLETSEPELIVATSDYGVPVPALVRKQNLIGMQFHPEKSGAVGLQLLQNFKEMIE